ncbi:MAG: MBOAT family protein [Acidobacteriota bacterium]
MLFNSSAYILFLALVFFLYWLLAGLPRIAVLLLLAANYFFYGQWSPKYLVLIFLSSTVDYLVGRAMGTATTAGRRKLLLVAVTGYHLTVLCTFKYFNFFMQSYTEITGWLGQPSAGHFLDVIVPVGISFFTFQSISYAVDVYRRKIEPCRDYLEYLTYVSFFPQMIAGPIVRATTFFPQFRNRTPLTNEQGARAFFLIMAGLVKKVAIADFLAINIVDRVFEFPERFSALEVLAAVYAYAIQIYCDFSGYTDIAIGSALLLGITLPINFDAPYTASSLPDFWRRWHISLSTWLRDYVYLPLELGSLRRNGAPRPSSAYQNLIITMLLGGLWHGAAWTFVIWGALHGLGLAFTRFIERLSWWRRVQQLKCWWLEAICLFLTFHFVCLGWIFFRAANFDRAFAILKQLGTLTCEHANLGTAILVVLAIGFVTHWLPERLVDRARIAFSTLPAPAQATLILAIGIALYKVSSSNVVPFIYFQF